MDGNTVVVAVHRGRCAAVNGNGGVCSCRPDGERALVAKVATCLHAHLAALVTGHYWQAKRCRPCARCGGVVSKDEVNSDKSPEFLAAMTEVLNISHRGQYWTEGRTFELRTPFREVTKSDLVRRYLHRGGELSHLLHSVSCYSDKPMHCGACSSCFKRWVALTNALDCDAIAAEPYWEHPAKWKPRQYWVDKLAHYPESRREETMRALRIASNSV